MVFKTNEINRLDIWRTGELAGLTEDIEGLVALGNYEKEKETKVPTQLWGDPEG